MQVSQRRADEIKKDMEAKTGSLIKKKKDIKDTKEIIEKQMHFHKQQVALKAQMKDMADPLTFVQQKN